MIEVGQHDVIPPDDQGLVEHHGSDYSRVRMRQSIGAESPTALEGGESVGSDLVGGGIVLHLHRFQRRLSGQFQGDLDDRSNVVRRESQVVPGLFELGMELVDLLAQVPLELEQLASRLIGFFCVFGLQAATPS